MGKKSKSGRGKWNASAASRPRTPSPRPGRSPPPLTPPPPRRGPAAPSSSIQHGPSTPSSKWRKHSRSNPSSPSRQGSPTLFSATSASATPSPPRGPSSPLRQSPATPSAEIQQGLATPSTKRRRRSCKNQSSPSRQGSPTSAAAASSSSPQRGLTSLMRSATTPSESVVRLSTPSSKRRKKQPSPSLRGSPTLSSARPATARHSSSPRRVSSPTEGTPAASSSSRWGGHPPSPQPLLSAPIKGTPVFDIYLDQLESSLRKAFQGAREYFEKILAEDSIKLPNGKLVTHPKGCVLFRTTPTAASTEVPIYALYRTKDLYLDSLWSDEKWYRFADYDPSIILPPEIPSTGTVILELLSKYGSLGFNPEADNQIKIGEDIFREHYNFLLGLGHIDLSALDFSGEIKCKEAKCLKKALLQFVVLAEALRFPELEEWILAIKEEKFIPTRLTKFFRIWGKLSVILHRGREEFDIGYIQDKELKDRLKTYEDVCSCLGIVNRINLGKQEKTKKKKQARRSNGGF